MKKYIFALLAIVLMIYGITYLPFPSQAEASPTAVWQGVSTGGNTVLAVTVDGTVYGWGMNSTGALGDGTTMNRTLPVQTTSAADWRMLSTSGSHTVAIKNDGTLWAWGRNWYGELGVGTTDDSSIPVQVGTDNDWVAVSAGGDHTLAIKSNGDLYSWGSGFYGQLGLGIDGNTADRNTPQLVNSSLDWVYVHATPGNSFAIASDGTLWGCGENYNYVLGLADSTRRKSFTRIGSASNWLTVSSRGGHTLALNTNNELWGWGLNNYGQLGSGDNGDKSTPARIGLDSDWAEVSCADSHTVARKSDGSVWTMGVNSEGQLGTKDEVNSNVPVRVGTDSDWISVAAGANHNVALKADGTLWAWGRSDSYQLGLGTKTSRHFPVRVTGAAVSIKVVSTSPADKAEGVTADAAVSVTFEDWVQDGINASTIKMEDAAGNRVDYTRTINGQTVTINRRGLLPNNTTYTVSFPDEGMQDVPAFSFTFATGETPFNFKRYAYHLVGYYPTGLTSGDFNKDSKKDIAVVNELDHNISIALGNGDGTFQPSATIGYLSNSRPSGIKAADINGDGNPDLVVARQLNNTMAIFLGNGNGTFQVPTTYATGTSPLMPATGDLDGDGDTDIAVVNRGSNNVSVYLNNGSGTFGSAVNYTTGSYPYWVSAADLNGDNRPDLVTANNSSDNVSVFINNGNGIFQGAVNYAAGSDPSCIAVGDINKDNKADLLVIREANYVSTMLGNGDGTFQARIDHAIPAYTSPPSGTIADMNGDGNNDLVVVTKGNDTLTIRLGNGDGTFQDALSFAAGNRPHGILAEDFNGDTKPDLVSTANGYSRISILLNESTGGGATDTTAPGWFVDSTLTASGIEQNAVTLNWTEATDNVSVTGYRIFMGETEIASVDGLTLTYHVTGLSGATSYTFTIKAGDAAGNWSTGGPATTVTTAALPDTTQPAWEGGSLTASNIGQTGLTLTWTAATDNVGVTGYRIYGNDILYTAVGNVLTTSMSGLTAGTSYAFRVEAGDAAGNWSTTGPSETVTTLAMPVSNGPSTTSNGTNTITAVGVQGALSDTYEQYFPDAGKLITVDNSALRKMDELGRKVVVVTPSATVILTPALAETILKEDASAKIILSITPVTGDSGEFIGTLQRVGQVVEIIATVNTLSGQRDVSGELELVLPYDRQHVQRVDRLGIYRLESSVWRYVGGLANTTANTITAKLKHFSRYCVFEDERTFPDLEGHWAKTDVERLASRYIIYGNSDGNYAPDRPVTRAEFAALLARVVEFAGISPTSELEVTFSDVPKDAWYEAAINKMARFGIIHGYTDGSFQPQQIISREEMAALIIRVSELLNIELPPTTSDIFSSYSDSDQISSWAEQSLGQAVSLGLLKGTQSGYLEPKETSTRAAAAVIIYRLLAKANLI